MRRPALVLLVFLTACGSESAAPPVDVPTDNPCVTAGQPCGCAGFPVRQGVLQCVGGGVVCVCVTPDTGVVDIPAPMDASEDRAAPFDAIDATMDVRGAADVADAVDASDVRFVPDFPTPTNDAGDLLCGKNPAGVTCTTDDDCVRCIPRHASGNPWCCYDEGRPGVRSICVASSRPCAEIRGDAGR